MPKRPVNHRAGKPRTRLTAREERFVAAFTGDAKAAAIAAGYSARTAHAAGYRLRHDPLVLAAIRARAEAEMRPAVAHRQERQSFWTTVMRNTQASMPDRLRASELLGKSEADFVDRFEGSISGIRPEVAVAAAMRRAQAK